ncbi:hypothetical protein OG349_06505 [Streptomyces sp. NBC_01317]|uniref:hypothetical protein n=1 Tax=Streptomyces sp. NBC_01317 TaxID=2903822 RepID=UPI002E13B4DE|nr:hypothetical protein OG349_06505 [Streptomyces sp. NBC_01317]
MSPTHPPTAFHPALEADGDSAHPAAWRAAGRPPSAALSIRALTATVEPARSAGFALATFDDGPLPPHPAPHAAVRPDAGVRAAPLSTRTDRIGLAPTIHVFATAPAFSEAVVTHAI